MADYMTMKKIKQCSRKHHCKGLFSVNKVIGLTESTQSTLRKIQQAAQKTPGTSSDQTHTSGFGLKLFFRSFGILHDNSNDRQHGNAVS